MQASKVAPKITLNTKEKSQLILTGVLTFLVLSVIEIAVVILLNQTQQHDLQIESSLAFLKKLLTFQTLHTNLWLWNQILLVIFLLINLLMVYIQVMSRYHQLQMRHVISELHYIADNHFDHRISFRVNPELQSVISSINALVDSTTRSTKEERRIEKSKDELITNVSHDIRTPLTSVIGYLGLIENGQTKSQKDLLKYTHTAYVKAQQMKLLVDDLFEFTKIQQTATSLNYIQINMTSMLAQLAASYELESQKLKLHIRTQTIPDPLLMDADPEKLGRVFNNLIINAFKYGKSATDLLLRARQVGKEAVIQVTNNGDPIPQDSLDHLFDRFYRVESSRSHETGGSGLGLAIAQSIVALHGGYIYATSNDDRTSFVMHLPLKKNTRLIKPDDVEASDLKYLNR